MADNDKPKGIIDSHRINVGPDGPYSALAALLTRDPYTYQNQWFFKQEITLDGYAFENCKFENCTLFVSKGTFRLVKCSLESCTVYYSDDALKTVMFFQANLPVPFRTGGPSLLPTFDPDGRITIG